MCIIIILSTENNYAIPANVQFTVETIKTKNDYVTTAISVFILSSPFFLYEFFFELVGSTKTRVSVLFRSNGYNFWCYFLKNTATIPRGQNYMSKFFRFCAPACKTNRYSLRSS